MPLVETKNKVIISVWEKNSNTFLRHCSQVADTYVVVATVADSSNPCYLILIQLEALAPSCISDSPGELFTNTYWWPDLQNHNLLRMWSRHKTFNYFIYLLAVPAACRSSRAREWTDTTGAAQATALITPDPYPTEPPANSPLIFFFFFKV